MIDMSSIINIENWLIKKIAGKMARVENETFVDGNGVSRPRGFLSYPAEATADATRAWGTLEYIPTRASGGWLSAESGAADPLLELIFSLKADYLTEAVFVMNRLTLASISKLKDGDGNYILSAVNGLNQDIRSNFQLLGFPVILMDQMPLITADSYSVAFGNFKEGFQILDHERGLFCLRDSLTNKPFTRYYCTKYCGSDVINFDAIKLLKFSVS
jgi:HK97 family phage major capsid protein